MTLLRRSFKTKPFVSESLKRWTLDSLMASLKTVTLYHYLW